MFFNVTPFDANACKAVAKVATALKMGNKKGAVTASDQDENLFKVMGPSEAETMKVNVVDLEEWLNLWVKNNLNSFEDGGWINVDKVPGFLFFDIRIENGKLFYVPFDVEEGESLMNEAEVLLSLKGVDLSF